MTSIIRCAIYTRKSSDEGLEQDFNSLHAQREAAEAYIKSQKHEGWQVIRTAYDDGGYSGGSMNRPALQQLMLDIEAGKIDVIVVYKVDRLSRSLHDFARMVEVFDRHNVSFVSVTQQFNTTSSMGRLTLNVLLSFAQFEREVTGERIRDKIAASKKKGMWMGGHPPFGYDAVDKRLIVNEPEAEIVRSMFWRYLELGTVRQLWHELIQRRIYNKPRWHNGKLCEAVPFSRGGLYILLNNPIYLGKVRHKGTWYDGAHVPIIEQNLWDAAQQQLKVNGPELRARTRVTQPSLLGGKLFDKSGEALIVTHTIKKGRRYRYYVSKSLKDGCAKEGTGWRLPGHEIEQAVLKAARKILADPAALMTRLQECDVETERIPRLLSMAATVVQDIGSGKNATNIAGLIHKAEFSQEGMTLHLALADGSGKPVIIPADFPMQIKRRGIEMRLVIGEQPSAPDQSLIKAVARAYSWFEELATGKIDSLEELVKREQLDRGYVSRLLKLAFLLPSTVESIVAGTQPAEWTLAILVKRAEWIEKRI